MISLYSNYYILIVNYYYYILMIFFSLPDIKSGFDQVSRIEAC